MNKAPKDFPTSLIELYAEAGEEWLHRLPLLLARFAERWSLKIMPPFEPLYYNYVAPAVRADGTSVVIKAGVPNPELRTEIEALLLFDGRGIVRLLEVDLEQAVFLLERLVPGTPLTCITDDEQATSIAAQVMGQLWRPVPPEHPFPSVSDWAAGLKRMRDQFGGSCGPFPPAIVDAAESLFAELIDSMAEPVLLHGDLHHGNILASERQPWLSVDPKGVVGEPEYEAGALLRNPMPQLLSWSNPERTLARRVDQYSEELGFDRDRLIGWGLAQAVLAAWWSYEDHGHGWEPWIVCAEHLALLKKGAA